MIYIFDFRSWTFDQARSDKSPANRKARILIRNSSDAGFPLTSAVSRPATETQGPTAQFNYSLRSGNEAQFRRFASAAAFARVDETSALGNGVPPTRPRYRPA